MIWRDRAAKIQKSNIKVGLKERLTTKSAKDTKPQSTRSPTTSTFSVVFTETETTTPKLATDKNVFIRNEKVIARNTSLSLSTGSTTKQYQEVQRDYFTGVEQRRRVRNDKENEKKQLKSLCLCDLVANILHKKQKVD